MFSHCYMGKSSMHKFGSDLLMNSIWISWTQLILSFLLLKRRLKRRSWRGGIRSRQTWTQPWFYLAWMLTWIHIWIGSNFNPTWPKQNLSSLNVNFNSAWIQRKRWASTTTLSPRIYVREMHVYRTHSFTNKIFKK